MTVDGLYQRFCSAPLLPIDVPFMRVVVVGEPLSFLTRARVSFAIHAMITNVYYSTHLAANERPSTIAGLSYHLISAHKYRERNQTTNKANHRRLDYYYPPTLTNWPTRPVLLLPSQCCHIGKVDERLKRGYGCRFWRRSAAQFLYALKAQPSHVHLVSLKTQSGWKNSSAVLEIK